MVNNELKILYYLIFVIKETECLSIKYISKTKT